MSVQDRIAAKALELFNQRGIEYVGMRELAAELDTKLGNITYYFPTKEDLILRLATELSELNAATLHTDNALTISSLFQMLRKHYENQHRYKCLFMSFVHLMTQYERMSIRYRKVEEMRKKTTHQNIEYLIANKYLKTLSEHEMQFLTSCMLFISRFWISEATISHARLSTTEQINHYLRLLAGSMLPYCTAKGKAQLSEIL